MGFISVRFHNFRNLINATVDLSSSSIYLIGENGQGKTNFLESLYILCFGSTFRTKSEKNICRHGETETGVFGKFSINSMDNDLSVKLLKDGKKISFNGKMVSDRKEIIRNIPCIVFCHDDLSFINGTPDRKRQFFDQTLSLYDSTYIDSLRTYKKVVRDRNIILKKKQYELLEVYNHQLAVTGSEICKKRDGMIHFFNSIFSTSFKKVSGMKDDLMINYHPSWKKFKDKEEILEIIRSKNQSEMIQGMTLTGPHRDRFIFSMNNRDFTQTASTGQIRLLSLILRSAQGVFFKEQTGQKPVLLLDDVLLELDRKRRELFLKVLPEYNQIFYTFLPDEAVMIAPDSIVYTVKDGIFYRQ